MLRSRRFILTVVCAVVFVLSVPAGAATRTWDGGGGDSEWATLGNWNPDGYADSDDLTVLSGTPTSAVNVIADNGGMITLDGSAAVANFSADTYIGYTTGESRLNVLNGANLSNGYGRLGFYGSTSGIATISGTGSRWTNVGDIYAGGGWSDTGGTGEMIITDGGVVSSDYGWLGYSTGSSGTVTVSGAGSKWECSQRIYVGRSGTGELIIADGGTVFSQWHSYVGHNSGSLGTVTVSGAGSLWNNALTDNFHIGHYGTGVLSITGGGAVSSKYGYLGYRSSGSGEVTVSGAGSTWTNSRDLYVGHDGQGTLNITDGGVVDSDYYVYIGYEAWATGEVTVDGSGSTWTNNGYGLYVGYDGQGTLNITNGGTVNATYKTQVAVNDGATGEIHFDGGTLATVSLLAGATQLTGTGTINTHGLISDVDLLFDSTHGPTHTFTLDSQPDQDITINLTQDSTGYLGAGYAGNGTTLIRDGVSVESSRGYIGYKAGATGTVTVDGSSSTWTNTYGLYVGCEGQGTLNIINGGSVSNYSGGRIGEETGSTGVVTVDGNGSTWANYGNIVVGYHGQGTLNITDGGTVSSESSYLGYYSASGTVTVRGTGSTWTNNGGLFVGYGYAYDESSGTGTLIITNGGTVLSAGGSIGSNDGSSGTATVSGTGSTWTSSGSLSVGHEDTGALSITDGGVVSNTVGTLGYYSGISGTATVSGAGSTWNNSDDLYVGRYGMGTLSITDGGAVSNTDGCMGRNSGSGTVTVSGAGSTWTNRQDLYVGGNTSSARGTGDLTIDGGGTVAVGDTMKIWSPGTVNLTGGTLTADSIKHTYGGVFNFTGGRLNVGTFTGDLANNGGTLAPGTSPGITNVQGDYTQASAGIMQIEIGGLAAGAEFDQVNVTGTAGLGGTLELSLIAPYTPDYYNEFIILTAGTISGAFDAITGYDAVPNMTLMPVYGADNITVVAIIPGDVSLDKFVGQDDLDIVLGSWGDNVVVGSPADPSFDGFVGQEDLDMVLGDWGEGEGSIPEPASASLLLLGSVAMLKRKRKSRA